jgi:hypothetical protein
MGKMWFVVVVVVVVWLCRSLCSSHLSTPTPLQSEMVELDHVKELGEQQRHRTEAEADELLDEKRRAQKEAEEREYERQQARSLVASPEKGGSGLDSLLSTSTGMDEVNAARIRALQELAALKQRQLLRESHTSMWCFLLPLCVCVCVCVCLFVCVCVSVSV